MYSGPDADNCVVNRSGKRVEYLSTTFANCSCCDFASGFSHKWQGQRMLPLTIELDLYRTLSSPLSPRLFADS